MSFWDLVKAQKTISARHALIWSRGLWRPLFWARHFFPESCSSETRPIGFSKMHVEEMRPGHARHRGVKRVIAAPANSSKSTLLVNLRAAHRIVYGLERFVCVGSGRAGQGADRVAAIREILADPKVVAFYGDQLPPAAGSRDFRTLDGCRVMAFGRQTAIRGLLDRDTRPTLFILDDIDGDSANERVRADDRTWFFRVLCKRGSDTTNYWLVGTVVHQGGIVATALRSDGWDGRVYKAMLQWPERQDLWEECRRIYADLAGGSRPERIAEARKFYRENRLDMDRGAEVLWPDRPSESLFGLHIQLWEDGRASFEAEKQNDPRAVQGHLIEADECSWFTITDGVLEVRPSRASPVSRYVKLSDLTTVAYLDPAEGKNPKRGSYGAIPTIGFDRYGNGYLLSCWLRRDTPDAQIAAMFVEWERWAWSYVGVEVNLYRGLLSDSIVRLCAERRDSGLPWQLPLERDRATESKTRITALQPWCANGWLALNDTLPEECIHQIETGVAEPNDAPDAITACIALAKKVGVIQT